MSLREKYRGVLSGMVPLGVAGVALLLGTAAPAAADQEMSAASVRETASVPVSARLAAIRDAVSDVGRTAANSAAASSAAANSNEGATRLAWWAWRNGGGGWRNGGGAWGNGGARAWGNGGARAWGNGGWHNGWHNYWRNF